MTALPTPRFMVGDTVKLTDHARKRYHGTGGTAKILDSKWYGAEPPATPGWLHLLDKCLQPGGDPDGDDDNWWHEQFLDTVAHGPDRQKRIVKDAAAELKRKNARENRDRVRKALAEVERERMEETPLWGAF